MVLFHSEAIKSVTLEPDRSRPSSVKCVGHFGSVRAGGTQSNCSLKAKCDGASLPSPPDRFDFLTQTEQTGGQRRGRQMVVVANERGEKAGVGGRLEEEQKEKREEQWERGRDTA